MFPSHSATSTSLRVALSPMHGARYQLNFPLIRLKRENYDEAEREKEITTHGLSEVGSGIFGRVHDHIINSSVFFFLH